MIYGQHYSPWLVAGVAAAASAYAEVVSQHLVRGMLDLSVLGRARQRLSTSRMMRLFHRRPALAIGITALSPVPDTLTRVLAAAARYPVGRYVLADTIGRFPKLFLPAALATTLHPSPALLLMIVGASSQGASCCVLVNEASSSRSLRRSPLAMPSGSAAARRVSR